MKWPKRKPFISLISNPALDIFKFLNANLKQFYKFQKLKQPSFNFGRKPSEP